jgi:hypothetical protein
MLAKGLTPILNVSDIEQSFAWFERLGWQKSWDWGSPPGFGAVCSGDRTIFLSDGHGNWTKAPRHEFPWRGALVCTWERGGLQF